MSKLYTLDEKLLVDTPEVRIGDKVYPVDNRQKTVKKIQALVKKSKEDGAEDTVSDQIMVLAFGPKAAGEIDEMNLPFPAQSRIYELVMAAMTGEDADSVRFQPEE